MTHHDTCLQVPDFERLNYFYGQLLGVRDFQAEQAYFREKLKLHNRCLHGYGVVCGLEVVAVPFDPKCASQTAIEWQELDQERQALEEIIADLEKRIESGNDEEMADLQAKLDEARAALEALRRRLATLCRPTGQDETPGKVEIECGLALDCLGNELIVRRKLCIDIWRELTRRERQRLLDDLEGDGAPVYISLCYCELPVEPVRPVRQDLCDATPECAFARMRDTVRVSVSLDPPPVDQRCEPCCTPCEEPCLLLARIDHYQPGSPIEPDQIHNEVRRPIGLYPPTVISGISWAHGATYTQDEAWQILGNNGLEIRFSRPIQSETVQPGVVDVWVIEGGGGRAAQIYHMAGEYTGLDQETTDRIYYRQVSGETLQRGDRVLITVRTSFLLDTCCRPVDGEHVGGRVPIILPEYAENERERAMSLCAVPPRGFGPWASGNGNPGGPFESWFFIEDSQRRSS